MALIGKGRGSHQLYEHVACSTSQALEEIVNGTLDMMMQLFLVSQSVYYIRLGNSQYHVDLWWGYMPLAIAVLDTWHHGEALTVQVVSAIKVDPWAPV